MPAVHRRLRRALSVAALSLLVACSGASDTDKPPTDGFDTDTEPYTAFTPIEWTVDRIADHDGGLQSEMAILPSGAVALTYFSSAPWDDGICDEIPQSPPRRLRHDLFYAERPVGGTWATEVVTSPIVAFTPTGLSLKVNGSGEPGIAYTGGVPDPIYCGGNDANLIERSGGTWTEQTAGATSGESATGEPASDAGFGVGFWPGLAYDSAGTAGIIHRDAHFVVLQNDDLSRADLEFAERNGGASWAHTAVDIGEGAGDYGELAYDDQDRPVAAYAITVGAMQNNRTGIWAARRDMTGTWERVQLHEGASDENVSVGIDPVTSEAVVAFYSLSHRAVRLWRNTDPTRFSEADAWAVETVGSGQYEEGLSVDLDFKPDGGIAMAYRRCKLVTSVSGGCDMNDEGVVFAHEVDGSWRYELVQEATTGSCGEYTALSIDGSGMAHIAFRCTEDGGGGTFQFRPYYASGQLP